MITPVILCGGSGTRLWPLSRKAYPKQLLSLSTGHSMLQDTLQRLKNISNVSSPIVICNQAHRFIVAEQLLEIGVVNAKIILEPCAKNTAPAVAIAALTAGAAAKLLVLPADHQMKSPDSFCHSVANARDAVKAGYLITFGIKPVKPETGYGYIKKAERIDNQEVYQVAAFVEKPDLEKAKQFMSDNNYYWNSGMFMFGAANYLSELEEFAPEILTICKEAVKNAKSDDDFIRIDEQIFSNCKSDSIDYAVMEKSKMIAMIPLHDCGWSDLGSWDTVYDTRLKDDNLNVIHGDVYADNVTSCYLHAEDRLLAVVGVKDHIVIETADAVLVAHKDYAQDVKKMVADLQNKNRPEIEFHRRVHRPWGHYEVIDDSGQFLAKRISVNVGASLSLQMHQHRSEHWVVISGQAEVTCGDKKFILEENQSTYIPKQAKHRLRNVGTTPLVIVEVQTGDYLGEDDIVRFEDHYGRDVLASVLK